MAELAEWLTIPEAAARATTSTRSIERRIASGEIETRKRPRPGKKPETVCHPRDIEKLLPPAHVMLGHVAPTAFATRPAPSGSRVPWEAALEKIATILSAKNSSEAIGAIPGSSSGKLWLTLDEAAERYDLGRSALRRLAKRVGPRGALRICRQTLEDYRG